MKNIRFYTITVLFANLPTPKGNRCLHVDILYLTYDIGSHVISCLRESTIRPGMKVGNIVECECNVTMKKMMFRLILWLQPKI